MVEIGITGGIGSGKSTVAGIFKSFGFAVYDADGRAKALYREDPQVKEAVQILFGRDIYQEDGDIDRKKLGEIVFNNTQLLQELNGIVHPATRRDFDRWSEDLVRKGYDKPFLLKEAAILYEAGSDKGLEGVIEVYAPQSVRLERVCRRDGVDAQSVLNRMNKQWPEYKKWFKSDFVIYSDGSHLLIPQVRAAIAYFSEKAWA